jgi:flagellar biosynthesis/type III secretory pathway protein FliH
MVVIHSRSDRALAATMAPHPLHEAEIRRQIEETFAQREAQLDARERALEQREQALIAGEQALQESIDAGIAEATRGWEAALTVVQQGIAKLRDDAAASRRAAAGQCTELALLLAGKLVGKLAAEDDQWLLERWDELLAAADGFEHVVLTVPASASAIIQQHMKFLGPEVAIELQADPALPPGTCRIHFGGTTLQADLADQWQELTAHYRDNVAKPVAEVASDE